MYSLHYSTLNQDIRWERDLATQCITRDIKAGEELYTILNSRPSVSNIPKQMLKHEWRLGLFLLAQMFQSWLNRLLRKGSADSQGRVRCINYRRLWFTDIDAEEVNEDEEDSLEVLGSSSNRPDLSMQ